MRTRIAETSKGMRVEKKKISFVVGGELTWANSLSDFHSPPSEAF